MKVHPKVMAQIKIHEVGVFGREIVCPDGCNVASSLRMEEIPLIHHSDFKHIQTPASGEKTGETSGAKMFDYRNFAKSIYSDR